MRRWLPWLLLVLGGLLRGRLLRSLFRIQNLLLLLRNLLGCPLLQPPRELELDFFCFLGSMEKCCFFSFFSFFPFFSDFPVFLFFGDDSAVLELVVVVEL